MSLTNLCTCITYVGLVNVPDLAHLGVTTGEGGNNCDTFNSKAPPHHKQQCAHHYSVLMCYSYITTG